MGITARHYKFTAGWSGWHFVGLPSSNKGSNRRVGGEPRRGENRENGQNEGACRILWGSDEDLNSSAERIDEVCDLVCSNIKPTRSSAFEAEPITELYGWPLPDFSGVSNLLSLAGSSFCMVWGGVGGREPTADRTFLPSVTKTNEQTGNSARRIGLGG